MIEIKFFIGSNNITHKPEYQKAVKVLSGYYNGFNLNKNEVGYWKGNTEKCFSITILDERPKKKVLLDIKKDLERILQQESVLVYLKKVGVV